MPIIVKIFCLQDALEFFLHFVDQVERAHSGKPDLDPTKSFKFGIEDRIACSSGKVAYNKRLDYILSLNIPLHEATNKGTFGLFLWDILSRVSILMILLLHNSEEVEAFHKLKAEKILEGKDV